MTNHYEVVIIGSGAGGGTLASCLAEAGTPSARKVVAFLASDAARYITATSIFADGGIMQSSPGI